MHRIRSVELFHARGDVEKGWLIRSYNWRDLVEARPGMLHLLILSPKTRLLRGTLQLLFAIVPALALLAPWRILYLYVASTIPSWASFLWLCLSILIYFGFWAPALLGTFYLFDLLTTGIQARSAKVVAALIVKEVRIGTFRHIMKAIVQPLVPVETRERELVLTVLSTRERLRSALKLATQPA